MWNFESKNVVFCILPEERSWMCVYLVFFWVDRAEITVLEDQKGAHSK